jgi:hypothetical protein
VRSCLRPVDAGLDALLALMLSADPFALDGADNASGFEI